MSVVAGILAGLLFCGFLELFHEHVAATTKIKR